MNPLYLSLFVASLGAVPIPPETIHLGPNPSAYLNPCTPLPGNYLLMNFGSTVSEAFSWEDGGVVAPTYGAMAEGYTLGSPATITGVRLYLTNPTSSPQSGNCDIYIWDDASPGPGVIQAVYAGVNVGPVASWPAFSCHDVVLATPLSWTGTFYIGYWPNWVGTQATWLVAGDSNYAGNPWTNIAPGLSYPTGWQSPSVLTWKRDQITSWGIGAWIEGEPSPVESDTWGAIKDLYR